MGLEMNRLRFALVASAAGVAMANVAGTAAIAATATHAAAETTVTEVIVTAQKHEESIQRLPGVVSAVAGERIKTLGISNAENLADHISGLTFYTQAGTNFVTLRGVGVPVDSGEGDPNISITVDGVVLPRGTEVGIDSTDLQRIEVLRGPQGTLYGRNATGGAINYISAAPTSTFSAMVSANVGNYDTWGVNGFVSGPVNDHLRIRLSVSQQDRDQGFVHNVFTGGSDDKLNRTSVRGALSADLTDKLTADVSLFYQHERFDAYQAILPPGLVVPNAPPNALGNLSLLGLVNGVNYSTKPFEVGSDFNEPSNRDTLLGLAKFTYHISDNITATSLTGFVDHHFVSGIDGDATSYGLDFIPSSGPNARSQPSQSFSQELNISGSIPRGGSWLVGAYYFHENANFKLPVVFDSTISTVFRANTLTEGLSHEENQAMALFGDVTVPITDRFRVFGGARISKEKLQGHDTDLYLNPNGIFQPFLVPLLPLLFKLPATTPTAISCLGTPLQSANTVAGYPSGSTFSQDHTPFTPRLGAQFDATNSIMLYVQYSKGFKDGGHSTSRCTNSFEPETLQSYEGGIKAQFLDKRLTLDASYFHYIYHNMQIFKFLPAGQGAVIENADAAIDGVDITANAVLTDHLQADVAATWLDDRFTNFCSIDPSSPTVAIGPCPSGVSTGQNLRGNRLPNAPDYTVNAGLDAFFPIAFGPFDRLTLRGEGRFVGTTDLDSYANRPQMVRAPYQMFDASATITSSSHDLKVRAFVNNMTNQAVVAHIIWVGTINGQWLPPRTFGVEVTKHF
jgi:iron complex outermembrane receptor protein